MTLAGGALGVSIAFVHDLAPHPKDLYWLAIAWSLFALSLLSVIISILLSQFALERALRDYDANGSVPGVPGGLFTQVTMCANLTGGIAFVLGVVGLTVFALVNLKRG